MTGRIPIYLLENHSQALPIWFQHRVHGATLLHLDAHLDVDWIRDECIQRITDAATMDEMLALESDVICGQYRGCYHIGNFIYAAIKLGYVDRIIWVQPDRMFTPSVGSLRLLLSEHIQGIEPDELRSFHLHDERIHGGIEGIELVVCTLNHLPDICEPVLLDIDLDYFVPNEPPWSTWCDPQDTLDRLRDFINGDVLVTFALSINGGFTPPSMRSLGTDIVDSLAKMSGQMVEDLTCEKSIEPAYSWGHFFLNAGNHQRALPYFEKALRTSPDVPGHAFYLGVALTSIERHGHALSYLEAAWRAKPFWVNYGMQYAQTLRHTDQGDEALELMTHVCMENPWSADSWFKLGLAYMQWHDSPKEALINFQKARELAPSNYQTYLWSGKAHRALGDSKKAAKLYADGLEVLGLMQALIA